VAHAPHPTAERAQAATLDRVSELLRALANPHRLAILLELGEGPRCVHELVDSLGISQPLVSQHLRVLKATDLVQGRRRGREVVYALADEHISHIVGDAIAHAGERPA
jgi:DNA-binding transcriptional ArsR family regulator